MSRDPKFSPILGWISLSSLDAFGRIGLKVLATVFFARWLTPDIFGQAALTIVVVAVLEIFVTAPFEEALSQRKVIRTRHFASCLTIVLLLSTVICVLAAAIGWGVDFENDDVSQVGGLVALFCLILFAQGPIAVYLAIARRHQAFERVAWCNLGGEVLGTATGVTLAFLGAGVWSLLSVRLVSRFVTLISLLVASPIRIRPGFSKNHVRELSAFAGWHFAGRLVKTSSDAAFQGLVAKYFGLSGAGYLNMALRIVDPLRGLMAAMSHNISMSFYMRMQDSPQKLRASVEQTMASTSLLLLPLFFGLAATGPTIIALLAGPSWSDAAPLVVCLALAVAMVSATNFLQAAFSAKGRADLIFFAMASEFVLMLVALELFSAWGLLAIGLTRMVSYGGEATFVTLAARRILGVRVRRSIALVTPIMLSAGAMGLVVFAVGTLPAFNAHPLVCLMVQTVTGLIVYSMLAAVFHREGLGSAYRGLLANPAR